MFNHVPVELQPITATNKNGVRLYETPEGNKYPSITTVLSVRNKQGLTEWRKRVGNDVANHIARTAAARGTKVHHMCEDYLNNMEMDFPNKWKEHKKNFLPYCLFTQLKEKALCNVNNIYAQEAGLYSDKYKVAGRVDCVAEYKGTLSIIDFKTSTKEKNDEWNESYYIQGSAYAEMFEERTGIEISQVVILVVTEDGTVQEFIKDKQEYLNRLSETIYIWSEENVQ
jgi:genome maintenance exonuclease 1|tara:strand:- start:488 stop:1168 length:681 start_codon:yes stop_codon:yes gene_type:complete